SRLVGDGKGDAPPETVEEPAALVARKQSRFRKQLLGVFRFEMAQQRIAAARRIADAKSSQRVLVEAAIFEIGPRRLSLESPLELLHEESLRLALHFEDGRALLGFLALLRRPFLRPRQRNAALLRHDAHGLGKLAAFHFHHEAEDVAAFAASEAVVDLPHRMHVERRALLGMKRAQPAEVLPGL